MELIVRSYGKFLLVATVFVIFWILVLCGTGNQTGEVGIFRMLGTQLTQETTINQDDFDICIEESLRSKPKISYVYAGVLKTDNYEVNELFEGKDCQGMTIPVAVRKIWGPNSEIIAELYNSELNQLKFEKTGIYRVRLRGVDDWNNVTTCDICVPVN